MRITVNMSKHTQSKNTTEYPYQRKENIKATAAKAKLAEARAQQIFYRLIETTVSSKDFVEMARYINPAKYKDIVTERTIYGLCGYPLCSNDFKDLYGDRKYIIRNNRIYDITNRRNFCSNVCFEASFLVCDQLAKDPLYLRDSDTAYLNDVRVPILDYLRGRFGEMVPITVAELKNQAFDSSEEKEIAEETLMKLSKYRVNSGKGKSKDFKDNVKKNIKGKAKKTSETSETHHDHEEEKIKCEDPHKYVIIVEKALREWMSFDSLREVLGDVYVRGMLEDIGQSWDNFNTTSGLRLDVEAKKKYIAICRKLDHEERQESADLPDMQMEDIEVRPQFPLPDYGKLQKDAKRQQLKVVSFYGGNDQYEEPSHLREEEVDALETIVEEGSGPHCLGEGSSEEGQKNCRKKKSRKVEIDEEKSTLPFIDNYSQVAWRQYIVQEKLKFYLQQIMEVTDLDGREVLRLVKKLIVTFELSPHNISFKPQQWQLIALIVLKMLTVRYPVIYKALQGEQALKLQEFILSGFRLDFQYLDRVLIYLTEIKHILIKNFETEQKIQSQQNERCIGNISQADLNLAEKLEKVKL